MIFHDTKIDGAYLIEFERIEDERGFFSRVFDEDEFAKRGLVTRFPQWSVSFNARAGTLRGMHYQAEPFPEVKLLACVGGAVYDVILDLRVASPSYGQWFAIQLDISARCMLYVPRGCAHGFQTLEPASQLLYHISEPFRPDLQRGVRWDDEAFGIAWPEADRIISERDRSFPDFTL